MLCRARGATAQGVVDMFLEDTVQSGVAKEDAADFVLTPTAVGGAGVKWRDCGVAQILADNGTGRWIVPEVEKDPVDVHIPLGRWEGRLRTHGVKLTPKNERGFQNLLARTWGVPESKLVGRITMRWVEVPKVAAAGPAPGACAVDPEAAWNLGDLPTLVRSYVKRQSLEDGTFMKYIKEEYLPEVLRVKKRVSNNIFLLYMTGD